MTTLVLLPGLASDAALWRDQQPVLAAGSRLLRVADVHARHATLADMAAALLAEVPGPLALAGTSMGGIVALEVWRQAPHRVAGLALLGTSARADTPELIALRTQACTLFAAGRMDEVLRANLVFAFHPDSLRGTSLAADYLAMVGRAGPEQLIRQNRAVMARADRRPMLAGIACPTLVVCGEADQLTPPECSRELAEGIAGARLHVLPKCGHMLTWEQPEAVTSLLLDWLARLAAPR
ncbi:alpha/beta fold hydrolase [Ideonella sp. A 288]|uniref:alpha/beta fold hydrolase n=1 Tax=Ideonella sp. A 288 TaxID=1962181 RepID=UPI000B4ABA56|nr:alpha/beta fold hydrolase [Ideonella sp. A 288]